jgi:acyl carrier protein
MSEGVLPESDLVVSLAKIWQSELLNAFPDPEADFVELNNSSLVAVRISFKIRDLTGTEFDAALLFDFPTPRAVAELLLNGDAVVSDGIAP